MIEVLLPPVEPGQYTSLAFTEAFTEALIASGIAGSIGSVGDALDNGLMESTIGLYKTELIDRDASWSGGRGGAGNRRVGSLVQRRPVALVDRLSLADLVRDPLS